MTQNGAFDAVADAVISGDEAALKTLLMEDSALIHQRSRHHGATLLHYIAANGVEEELQRTPANAVQIARILLEAGADPNAKAEFYGRPAAALGLLVSSVHPHRAGLQAALACLLLDAGADGNEALLTALAFGYGETAQVLAQRLPIDTLPIAAGLGRIDIFDALMPVASAEDRHQALALAALHGQVAILERLVAAGGDVNRLNPIGFHGHATPLHLAVWKGHDVAVRWLVEHGARIDIPDAIHGGTPLGWARHEGHATLAFYLESRTV